MDVAHAGPDKNLNRVSVLQDAADLAYAVRRPSAAYVCFSCSIPLRQRWRHPMRLMGFDWNPMLNAPNGHDLVVMAASEADRLQFPFSPGRALQRSPKAVLESWRDLTSARPIPGS